MSSHRQYISIRTRIIGTAACIVCGDNYIVIRLLSICIMSVLYSNKIYNIISRYLRDLSRTFYEWSLRIARTYFLYAERAVCDSHTYDAISRKLSSIYMREIIIIRSPKSRSDIMRYPAVRYFLHTGLDQRNFSIICGAL